MLGWHPFSTFSDARSSAGGGGSSIRSGSVRILGILGYSVILSVGGPSFSGFLPAKYYLSWHICSS